MHPELREYIKGNQFYRGTVRRVVEMLPADDAELDALITETVEEADASAFRFVTTAAVSQGRPVDARHLARGAMMLMRPELIGIVSLRMQGDVPEFLLKAMEISSIAGSAAGAALLICATLCKERRNGVFPPDMIPLARKLARRHAEKPKEEDPSMYLLTVALIAEDEGLKALIRQSFTDFSEAQWKDAEVRARKFGESWISECRQPVFDRLTEKGPNVLASGKTMRRAVAKVGRNEPCHCGSGKKYKHCCYDKDQDRLRDSSDIAGRTKVELGSDPERFLTSARIKRTHPNDIARFDPVKIPREVLPDYFLLLVGCKLLDRAADAFEALGYSEELDQWWDLTIYAATRAGQKDVVRRLVDLRSNPAEVEENLHISSGLLLAEDNPARMISILEEGAMDALKKNEPDNLKGFAYGLLYSKFRSVGIFVARSMIPILPPDMALSLFNDILAARDKLNLPPDDLYSDILDKRVTDRKTSEAKEAEALRHAQRSLDAKAEEVRELKESLSRLERDLRLREKIKESAPTTSVPIVPTDERALKELREKVESLKSALHERHNERNELRRELEKAQTDLETLRKQSASSEPQPDAEEKADGEEDLLMPQETENNHPIRIIEFPRNFTQRLTELPRQIARGTMTMLGGLAAGESASFVGAVRIKACPGIMRQRIGGDFRLLFRLLPDRLQVIDVIPRQDLERKIKTLI